MRKPIITFKAPSGRFAIRASNGTYLRQAKVSENTDIYYSHRFEERIFEWVEVEDATLIDFAEAEKLIRMFPAGICTIMRVERQVRSI